MRAVILVGGEGTRLRPLTYTTPKQLLPVAEVRMIERVLGYLGAHGVDRAVLSLGYQPDAFISAFPGGRAAGVSLEYAVEPEPLDTAGAIAFAARRCGLEGTFLALNGDVLTDLDLPALLEFHRHRRADASIHLAPVEDPSAYGVVRTDDEGKVLDFVEKPPLDSAPTNLVNAGTYVLEPSVLSGIPPGARVSIEREIFPQLASRGRLYAMAADAYWLDTGTPEKYLKANVDLLSGCRPGPPAPGATEIAPGRWVIGKPEIAGRLGPASLVGRGAVLEAGSEVVASVVGGRARIAAGARLAGSVLLAGAVVGRQAVVEDSIVGPDARVGDGAVLTGASVLAAGARVPEGAHLDRARIPAGSDRSGVPAQPFSP